MITKEKAQFGLSYKQFKQLKEETAKEIFKELELFIEIPFNEVNHYRRIRKKWGIKTE